MSTKSLKDSKSRMSIEEIISVVQELSLSEKIIVMRRLLESVESDALSLPTLKTTNDEAEARKRRKAYKIEAFDLGEDVMVDRDEIYSGRGGHR